MTISWALPRLMNISLILLAKRMKFVITSWFVNLVPLTKNLTSNSKYSLLVPKQFKAPEYLLTSSEDVYHADDPIAHVDA